MQRYVPYENHLAMFFLKPYVKMPGWVIGKPGEEERVGIGDAARRASEAFPFRVFAYGDQYLPDGALDPRPIHPVFRASVRQLHGKGELLVGCSSPVS
jgi:hypothetical protein